MADEKNIKLVYDRECPMCDFYCQRIDVDMSAGQLLRIDAREDSEIMQEITSIGLDIDEGMVVKIGERFYYGSDAIHKLATLSSRNGFFNAMAYSVFRWPKVARVAYPVLVACRNLLLKLLRKTRINNLDLENNDRF